MPHHSYAIKSITLYDVKHTYIERIDSILLILFKSMLLFIPLGYQYSPKCGGTEYYCQKNELLIMISIYVNFMEVAGGWGNVTTVLACGSCVRLANLNNLCFVHQCIQLVKKRSYI